MRILKPELLVVAALILLLLFVSDPMFEQAAADDAFLLVPRFPPPEPPWHLVQPSPRYTAPLEVAKVLGRHPPCARVEPELIYLVAREAVREGLDASLLAATVAVESGCNQYAVSRSGAVGYMQIMPRVWRERYDFTERYNLFNARDNVRVGAMILGDLTRAHGLREGVRRYQGTGRGCATCDAGYTSKILVLAKGR